MLTRGQAIEVLDAVKELSVTSNDYRNFIEQIIDGIGFEENGFHVWGCDDETVEKIYNYIEGDDINIDEIVQYAYAEFDDDVLTGEISEEITEEVE